MRSRFLLPAIVLAALVVLAPASASTSVEPSVYITKDGFDPVTVNVKAGEQVKWLNVDWQSGKNHRLSSPEAGFTSPVLGAGAEFVFVFKNTGRYTVRDLLVPANTGTVVVGVGPASYAVTATATPKTVSYGNRVKLAGQIATKRAGQTITVQAKPYGARKLQAVGATVTKAAGKWTYSVKPRLSTEYLAVWSPPGESRVGSKPLAVKVQPALTLRVKSASGGRTTFVTSARSARSYNGKYVLFQRRTNFGQWITLKKVTLRSGGSATFTQALPSGRSTVRVSMPQSQVGRGYVAGAKTLTVSR